MPLFRVAVVFRVASASLARTIMEIIWSLFMLPESKGDRLRWNSTALNDALLMGCSRRTVTEAASDEGRETKVFVRRTRWMPTATLWPWQL